MIIVELHRPTRDREGYATAQIDRAYGHLVLDSDEYVCGLLYTYDTAATAQKEEATTNG